MRTVEQEQALARGLSTKDVAHKLGVSVPHVNGLIDDGELRAVDTARKGSKVPHWRIMEDDLEAFIESRQNRPREKSAA